MKLRAAPILALALIGCGEDLPPRDDELETPVVPPPADALEARLRELGRERAPFMILDGEPNRGELDEGGARDFGHVMHPGWCYKILGAGGDGVEDLGLRVYDPDQVFLQRDTTSDPEPYIGQMRPICPTASGTYRIEVRMVRGSGPFVVQVYRSI